MTAGRIIHHPQLLCMPPPDANLLPFFVVMRRNFLASDIAKEIPTKYAPSAGSNLVLLCGFPPDLDVLSHLVVDRPVVTIVPVSRLDIAKLTLASTESYRDIISDGRVVGRVTVRSADRSMSCYSSADGVVCVFMGGQTYNGSCHRCGQHRRIELQCPLFQHRMCRRCYRDTPSCCQPAESSFVPCPVCDHACSCPNCWAPSPEPRRRALSADYNRGPNACAFVVTPLSLRESMCAYICKPPPGEDAPRAIAAPRDEPIVVSDSPPLAPSDESDEELPDTIEERSVHSLPVRQRYRVLGISPEPWVNPTGAVMTIPAFGIPPEPWANPAGMLMTFPAALSACMHMRDGVSLRELEGSGSVEDDSRKIEIRDIATIKQATGVSDVDAEALLHDNKMNADLAIAAFAQRAKPETASDAGGESHEGKGEPKEGSPPPEKKSKTTEADSGPPPQQQPLQCPVCYEPVGCNNMMIPLCGHALCKVCLRTLMGDACRDAKCPKCREVIRDVRGVFFS